MTARFGCREGCPTRSRRESLRGRFREPPPQEASIMIIVDGSGGDICLAQLAADVLQRAGYSVWSHWSPCLEGTYVHLAAATDTSRIRRDSQSAYCEATRARLSALPLRGPPSAVCCTNFGRGGLATELCGGWQVVLPGLRGFLEGGAGSPGVSCVRMLFESIRPRPRRALCPPAGPSRRARPRDLAWNF